MYLPLLNNDVKCISHLSQFILHTDQTVNSNLIRQYCYISDFIKTRFGHLIGGEEDNVL